MSPESLKIIASANAELCSFLNQASANGHGRGVPPDDALAAIAAQLPAIAATIQKAGRAIGPSIHSENLDRESRSQIDLYAQSLQKLKTLLSPLLVQAEARRQQLAHITGKIHETLSWFNSLKLTETD
jgi:hypothetical protein